MDEKARGDAMFAELSAWWSKQMCLDEVGTAFMLRRKMLGLSQEELAEKVGLSRAVISLIELGKENPTTVTLAQIARGLSCEIRIALMPPKDAA